MYRDSLLRMVLGNAGAACQSADELSTTGTWADAFATAKKWNVSAQLADRIQELGLQLDVPEWHEFRGNMIATFACSASRASKGVAALRHLEVSGIPAIAFKGLASMARLYPKPGKRTIKDADLLVDRQHLQAALNSLSDLGFRPLENHALERLETFLDHSPGFSGNKAIVLYGPGDFELDLHWAVGVAGLEPAALLGRSETVTLFGTPVRVASFEDALLLTAKHAIRENLTVDAMCRDLLDIRRSWERSDSWRNFEEILADPALRNNLVPLLAITDVLRVLDSDHRAVGEAAERLTGLATRTERKAARRLCELFFYQVKHGPVTKDLLYLAHSRPAKQVIVAAWTNWREYRDLMRSLEEKLDGEEVPLVRRLRLLAGAIIKTQPGQLRSIRALARLKYRD